MNYIHPTAIIGPNVEMGDNNYIGPYCIIGYPAEHKEFWPEMSKCKKRHFVSCGVVKIGHDNVFTGHVTIDAGTNGATQIGNRNWFLKHSHVGHDSVIGSSVTISCGAKIGGHAVICYGANIGLNACIHQRQYIKENCMIGMGAVVTKGLKTEPGRKYAGVPAKDIGENIKK